MNFHLPARDVNGLILTFVFWLHVTQRTLPFHGRVNDLMICFNDFLDISNILVIEATGSTHELERNFRLSMQANIVV